MPATDVSRMRIGSADDKAVPAVRGWGQPERYAMRFVRALVLGVAHDRADRLRLGGVRSSNRPDVQTFQTGRQTMINTAKALKEEDPKRWTQSRIAAALGVSREWVCKWLDISNGTHTKANTDARVSVPKEKRTEIVERLDAGEAQSQVAAALGVERATVSRWLDITNVQPHKANNDARVPREVVRDWLGISIGGPAKANTDARGVAAACRLLAGC